MNTTDPSVYEESVTMPLVFTKRYKTQIVLPNCKIAGFDLDHTLIKPKEGRTFPKNAEDWEFYNSTVRTRLCDYVSKGYVICIFTHQTKDWKFDMIDAICKDLDLPLFVTIVFGKDNKFRKPNPMLFYNTLNAIITSNNASQINKTKSFFVGPEGESLGTRGFFVGDAGDKSIDFSDSDYLFARNCNLEYIRPETFFYKKSHKHIREYRGIIIDLPLGPVRGTVIVTVGYPACGKSTFCEIMTKLHPNYIHILGDLYKTPEKMIKYATTQVKLTTLFDTIEPTNKPLGIIFDSTAGTIVKRKKFIDFAKENNFKVMCVYWNTPIETAMERNEKRFVEKKYKIPKIAFYTYRKHFQEPTINEGFDMLRVI